MRQTPDKYLEKRFSGVACYEASSPFVQNPTEMKSIFSHLGVTAINAWHRLMRGLYLEYGRRSGPDSLDSLAMSCLVHGPEAFHRGSWVERLMNEVGELPGSPVLFGLFNENDDLTGLRRFALLLVDHDVYELFLSNPTLPFSHQQRVVVVGGDPLAPQLSVGEDQVRISWVDEPPAKGGLAWLQQFSS